MAFIDGDLIEIKTILYFNCVLECLFILDFLIGFISAQENSSGDLEIRPKYIIKQYLSSGWFLIDFISCFPKNDTCCFEVCVNIFFGRKI